MKRASVVRPDAAEEARTRLLVEIGKRIRERRDAIEMTQGKLGKILGVSTTTISNWENPDRPKAHTFRLEHLPGICAALRVTPDALIPYDESIGKSAGSLHAALGEKLAAALAQLPSEAHESLWAVVGRFSRPSPRG